MATASLIPVSEYLRTTYRPDRDYLEGETKERNVGERPHATVQGYVYFLFRLNEKEWKVKALPEQRVQVSEQRFRIPDVCVVRDSDPNEPVVRVAPLLCVEVLSKDDTPGDLQERVNDYTAMGVRHVWAIDPWKRLAYYCSPDGLRRSEDGLLRIPESSIVISLSDVFAELDR